jgi:hypothetical protein
MKWENVRLRDLENVFNDIFNPQLLYGEQAVIYDEAIKNSNHFGTTWQQEIKKNDEHSYVDFIVNYLKEEGCSLDDFLEK